MPKPHQETCKEMGVVVQYGWVEVNLMNPYQLLLRRDRGRGRLHGPALLLLKFCPFCGDSV